MATNSISKYFPYSAPTPSGGGLAPGATLTGTSNTAAANTAYPVDVSGAVAAVTLPAAPDHGARVRVTDAEWNAEANNITVQKPAGATIGNVDDVFVLDNNGQSVTLEYNQPANDWMVVGGTHLGAGSGGGGGLTAAAGDVTGTATVMEANQSYTANTTGAAVEITLPPSPTKGDKVRVTDKFWNAYTNNITIKRNASGENIASVADDALMEFDGQSVTLEYSGDSTEGWMVIAGTHLAAGVYTEAGFMDAPAGATMDINLADGVRTYRQTASANFTMNDIVHGGVMAAVFDIRLKSGTGGYTFSFATPADWIKIGSLDVDLNSPGVTNIINVRYIQGEVYYSVRTVS